MARATVETKARAENMLRFVGLFIFSLHLDPQQQQQQQWRRKRQQLRPLSGSSSLGGRHQRYLTWGCCCCCCCCWRLGSDLQKKIGQDGEKTHTRKAPFQIPCCCGAGVHAPQLAPEARRKPAPPASQVDNCGGAGGPGTSPHQRARG